MSLGLWCTQTNSHTHTHPLDARANVDFNFTRLKSARMRVRVFLSGIFLHFGCVLPGGRFNHRTDVRTNICDSIRLVFASFRTKKVSANRSKLVGVGVESTCLRSDQSQSSTYTAHIRCAIDLRDEPRIYCDRYAAMSSSLRTLANISPPTTLPAKLSRISTRQNGSIVGDEFVTICAQCHRLTFAAAQLMPPQMLRCFTHTHTVFMSLFFG